MAFLQDIMPLDIGKGLLTRRRRMPDMSDIYTQLVRYICPTRWIYIFYMLGKGALAYSFHIAELICR